MGGSGSGDVDPVGGKQSPEIVAPARHEESDVPELKAKVNPPKGKKAKKRPRMKKRPNPNLYIQGIAEETTVADLVTFFSKCGLIKEDAETGEPRVKIYKDENGKYKGDGLVTFLKEASVDLAIQLFHEYEYLPGHMMLLSRAVFDVVGEKGKEGENAKERVPKRRNMGLERKKLKEQSGRLAWTLDDEDYVSLHERTVVIAGLFDPDDFRRELNFGPELKEDIAEECESLGPVERINVYELNPDGVVTVRFVEKSAADACVAKMHGRLFDGRKLHSSIWDGRTNFKVVADHSDEEKRLSEFGAFLNQTPDDNPG